MYDEYGTMTGACRRCGWTLYIMYFHFCYILFYFLCGNASVCFCDVAAKRKQKKMGELGVICVAATPFFKRTLVLYV